jgi:type I restriction enzyme S subunit
MVEKANSLAAGANLPRLSPSSLEDLEVPSAPIEDQRRIADILDRADALRAKRRAAIAHLDELTQAIFIDMFGDPIHGPKKCRQIAMGELLSAPPIFGSMIPPEVDGGSWLSLRVGNIQDWRLDLADRKFIELPTNMQQRHSVRDGDLLLARAIASQEHLGKAVVVYPGKQKWAFDSHLMRLRFNPQRADPRFIQTLLKNPSGRALFLRASRRSAVQYNINTGELSGLVVPIPSIEAQRDFIRVVDQIGKLHMHEIGAQASLNSLFASLQDRAFRGAL